MSNPNSIIQFVENKTEKKVAVLIDGELFTNYMYPSTIAKPVLYPLITKSGKKLTRGYPLEPQVGERVDHPHHIGYWLNYGNVNGYDFWNNSNSTRKGVKYGTIYHQKIEKLDKKNGLLEASAIWTSDDKTDLLEENTQFYFSQNETTRQIDRVTTLTALMDVSFEDDKEGMLGVRVIRALELPAKKGAIYLNKNGKPNTQKTINNDVVTGNYLSSENITSYDAWGTRAKWMHLYGQLDNHPISISIIDHPDNIGYPTYWHARDYGLFAANPLGQNIFSKGKESLNFKLAKGETVTFKYRLLINGESELSASDLTAAFTDFSNQY